MHCICYRHVASFSKVGRGGVKMQKKPQQQPPPPNLRGGGGGAEHSEPRNINFTVNFLPFNSINSIFKKKLVARKSGCQISLKYLRWSLRLQGNNSDFHCDVKPADRLQLLQHYIQNYNASICVITMKASLRNVDFK